MLRKNDGYKENMRNGPSSTAKDKVQQLRNQFFKKVANEVKESTPRAFTGADIDNHYTPT